MLSAIVLLLQFLSLSFWIGGSAVIILVVAPQVFRHAGERKHAGKLMATILSRFGALFLLNALVLTSTFFLQLAYLNSTVSLKLRIALSIVSFALLVAAYERYAVQPRLETSDVEGEAHGPKATLFRRLHARSMALFVLNLFLGVAVVMTLLLPLR